MFAVFGLGNPGTEYLMNRHNVGFMVADKMASDMRIALKKLECKAIIGKGNRISGEDFLLCKPMTFMNSSGESVKAVLEKYQLLPSQCIVVHDDLDLPFGLVRIKQTGGSGGHNGIKSITRILGTPDYIRIKIGIDRPSNRESVIDYVLSDFTKREQKEIFVSLETAIFAILDVIDYGYIHTANKYNGKKDSNSDGIL